MHKTYTNLYIISLYKLHWLWFQIPHSCTFCQFWQWWRFTKLVTLTLQLAPTPFLESWLLSYFLVCLGFWTTPPGSTLCSPSCTYGHVSSWLLRSTTWVCVNTVRTYFCCHLNLFWNLHLPKFIFLNILFESFNKVFSDLISQY